MNIPLVIKMVSFITYKSVFSIFVNQALVLQQLFQNQWFMQITCDWTLVHSLAEPFHLFQHYISPGVLYRSRAVIHQLSLVLVDSLVGELTGRAKSWCVLVQSLHHQLS